MNVYALLGIVFCYSIHLLRATENNNGSSNKDDIKSPIKSDTEELLADLEWLIVSKRDNLDLNSELNENKSKAMPLDPTGCQDVIIDDQALALDDDDDWLKFEQDLSDSPKFDEKNNNDISDGKIVLQSNRKVKTLSPKRFYAMQDIAKNNNDLVNFFDSSPESPLTLSEDQRLSSSVSSSKSIPSSNVFLLYDPLKQTLAPFMQPFPSKFRVESRLIDLGTGLLCSLWPNNGIFIDFMYDDPAYSDKSSESGKDSLTYTLVNRFYLQIQPEVSSSTPQSILCDADLRGWYLAVLLGNVLRVWNLRKLQEFRQSHHISSESFKTHGFHILTETEIKQMLVIEDQLDEVDPGDQSIKLHLHHSQSLLTVHLPSWTLVKVFYINENSELSTTERAYSYDIGYEGNSVVISEGHILSLNTTNGRLDHRVFSTSSKPATKDFGSDISSIKCSWLLQRGGDGDYLFAVYNKELVIINRDKGIVGSIPFIDILFPNDEKQELQQEGQSSCWVVDGDICEQSIIGILNQGEETTLKILNLGRNQIVQHVTTFYLNVQELHNRRPGFIQKSKREKKERGEEKSKPEPLCFCVYEGGFRFNTATLVNTISSAIPFNLKTKDVVIMQRFQTGFVSKILLESASSRGGVLLVNGPWRAIFDQDSKSMHAWNVLTGQCRQFSNVPRFVDSSESEEHSKFNQKTLKLNFDGGWSCLSSDGATLITQFGTHWSMFSEAQTVLFPVKIKDYHVAWIIRQTDDEIFYRDDSMPKYQLDKGIFIDTESQLWLRDYSGDLDPVLLKNLSLSDKKFSKVEWVGSNADILAVHTTSETVLYDARRVWKGDKYGIEFPLKQAYLGPLSKISYVKRKDIDHVFLFNSENLLCFKVNRSDLKKRIESINSTLFIQHICFFYSDPSSPLTPDVTKQRRTEPIKEFIVLENKRVMLCFGSDKIDIYSFKNDDCILEQNGCLLWDSDDMRNECNNLRVNQYFDSGRQFVSVESDQGQDCAAKLMRRIKDYLIQ